MGSDSIDLDSSIESDPIDFANKEKNEMNMLSSVAPWDLVAEGYSEVTMKLFRGYVDKALAQVDLDETSHVLDIACGPGTLALIAAQSARQVKAIDFSEAMIEQFDRMIHKESIDNIETFCGDAQQLPYEDNAFDAAFSIFGLIFFPDRMKAYKEILRTLKPGGKTVISSWAPTVDSPLMMTLFGAIRAINPDVPEPQTAVESLENPEFFKAEMIRAGFKDVEILPVSDNMEVTSLEQFWEDMVKGSAPLVMMKNNMPEAVWQEKNRIALSYLRETLGEMPTTLSASAWLGVGTK